MVYANIMPSETARLGGVTRGKERTMTLWLFGRDID
jgi:hypothetical protein